MEETERRPSSTFLLKGRLNAILWITCIFLFNGIPRCSTSGKFLFWWTSFKDDVLSLDTVSSSCSYYMLGRKFLLLTVSFFPYTFSLFFVLCLHLSPLIGSVLGRGLRCKEGRGRVLVLVWELFRDFFALESFVNCEKRSILRIKGRNDIALCSPGGSHSFGFLIMLQLFRFQNKIMSIWVCLWMSKVAVWNGSVGVFYDFIHGRLGVIFRFSQLFFYYTIFL